MLALTTPATSGRRLSMLSEFHKFVKIFRQLANRCCLRRSDWLSDCRTV